MNAQSYALTWRTTPARIAEEHRLDVARIEADATRAAWRDTAYIVARRHGLALTQHKGV